MAAMVIVVASAGARAAAAEPEPAATPASTRSAVVLATVGRSFPLGARRVANLAPPGAELRVGLRLRRAPWAVPEVGLGFIVFPELVPTVSVGLRAHPLAGRAYLRHLFARAGATALAVTDGFDVALGGEAGVAISRARVIGWAGLGAERFLVNARVAAQLRLGVGVTF
jgi:hypothetical protein